MNIEISPGVRTAIPAGADFPVRIESSFSAGQLVGVTPYLEYRRWDGASGEVAGIVSGTDFVFQVTAGLFTPGEWTLNFRALVSGLTSRWPEPAILVVGDPLSEGVNCGC